MIFILIHLISAMSVTGEPIIELKPLCPDKSGGVPEIHLTVEVPAFGLANCKNGEKVLNTTNEVLHKLDGTFAQVYAGPLCQFYKKNGSNTYTVEVQIGWGEKSNPVIRRKQRHTLTCAYDAQGTATSSDTTLALSYISPRERQSLLGKEHESAVFDLKVVDILDREVTSYPIALGKRIRLKVIETNSSTVHLFDCPNGFEAVGNNCYHIAKMEVSISITSAAGVCGFMDSELLAVETREEFDALHRHFKENGIEGMYLTSAMITGKNTAVWTSANSNQLVQVDEHFWFPGYSMASSRFQCISLQSAFGEFGYRDTSCREQSGRNVVCECPKIHIVPVHLPIKVKAFRALSCVARNAVTSYGILRAGCGDGLVFDKKSGFTTTGGTVYSPYFDAFRLRERDSVQFQCNFTICESVCDGDSCSVESRKRRSETEPELESIDNKPVFTVMSHFLTYVSPSLDGDPLPTKPDTDATNLIQTGEQNVYNNDHWTIGLIIGFFLLISFSLISLIFSLYVCFRYEGGRFSSATSEMTRL